MVRSKSTKKRAALRRSPTRCGHHRRFTSPELISPAHEPSIDPSVSLGEEDSYSSSSSSNKDHLRVKKKMDEAPLKDPLPDVPAEDLKSLCDEPISTHPPDSTPILPTGNETGIPPPLFNSWSGLFEGLDAEDLKLDSHLIDDDVILLNPSDVCNVCDEWGFCLQGWFAGIWPGIENIRKLISFWNVECSFSLHIKSCVIFRFKNRVDWEKIFQEGPYSCEGRTVLLRKITNGVILDLDNISNVPVWVKFPNLPFECWHRNAFSKIASKLGKPICIDKLTQGKKRTSYARILVEVNAAIPLPTAVKIKLPDGQIFNQPVHFETHPRFCSGCSSFGHYKGTCPGVKKPTSFPIKRPSSSTNPSGSYLPKSTVSLLPKNAVWAEKSPPSAPAHIQNNPAAPLDKPFDICPHPTSSLSSHELEEYLHPPPLLITEATQGCNVASPKVAHNNDAEDRIQAKSSSFTSSIPLAVSCDPPASSFLQATIQKKADDPVIPEITAPSSAVSCAKNQKKKLKGKMHKQDQIQPDFPGMVGKFDDSGCPIPSPPSDSVTVLAAPRKSRPKTPNPL